PATASPLGPLAPGPTARSSWGWTDDALDRFTTVKGEKMKRYLGMVLVLLAVGPAGCGKARPVLAGGKPVRHWVTALGDPDPKVRRQAALKLGNVGPGDPAVLPALTAALRDGDAGVRRQAIL